MKNLLELQRLQESFNHIAPRTFEGRQFIENNRNFDESSYVQVYTLLDEGAKCRDHAVSAWAKNEQAKISVAMPYAFQVGYALEEARNTGNLFAETMNEEYGYLTQCNESQVVDAIKDGVFENAAILPRLKYLHEHLCAMPEAKNKVVNGSRVFNPISYIHESAGCQWFMVEGKIFKYDGEKITEEVTAPTQEFAEVNQAISELPYDTDKEIFSLTMLPGAVNVTKKGKVTINGQEVTGKEFVGAMSSAISECMNPETKQYNIRMADNICKIMENFDKLCVLDQVHTVKNVTTNESYSILSHPNRYYLFANTTAGQSVKPFLSINECVRVVKANTSVNLYPVYAKQCMNEMKDVKKVTKLLKEQKEVKTDIEEALKELELRKALATVGSPEMNEIDNDIEELNKENDIAQLTIDQYESILDSVKEPESAE